jgi:hypothetical protein
MSLSSDKLPAISGIAQIFAKNIPSEYIAGLWRQDIRDWLLWQLDEDPKPRPPQYRAPTWSWASVDGRITLNTSFAVIEVVDCNIELVEPKALLESSRLAISKLEVARNKHI